jgi:protein N-terminal amidase
VVDRLQYQFAKQARQNHRSSNMRLATLQFDSVLGEVEGNITKADALLLQHQERLEDLDLLILPELAFTGYNHKSYADIEPYLEPKSTGPSTLWAEKTARNLKCVVAVGYPERATLATGPQAYNSLVFVSRTGEFIAHTRKSFLYYTDETWASEGQGFFAGELWLGSSSEATRVSAGICMDINPYRFEAPWTSYEFANHTITSASELVILSMAWITRLPAAELQGLAKLPDLETVGYWLERMRPLMGPRGIEQEVVIVIANRCGQDGDSPVIGPVSYAGSSTVFGISRGDGRVDGEVRIWDMLGRAEEGVLVVDTRDNAKYGLKRSLPAEGMNREDGAGLSDHE